jgi:hypothetical protein
MSNEQDAYQLLLDKVEQVFGDALDRLSPTQETVVNRLIELSIDESGSPAKVTLAQVQGVKKMLEQEFGMATPQAQQWEQERLG